MSYKCQTCGKSFNCSNGLRIHRGKKHSSKATARRDMKRGGEGLHKNLIDEWRQTASKA